MLEKNLKKYIDLLISAENKMYGQDLTMQNILEFVTKILKSGEAT